MQSVSSRIWTRIAVFISYGDNDYTTGTSNLRIGTVGERESGNTVQSVWLEDDEDDDIYARHKPTRMNKTFDSLISEERPRGVMFNVLDCHIVVSEWVRISVALLRSLSDLHPGERYELSYTPSCELSNATIVLIQWWLLH